MIKIGPAGTSGLGYPDGLLKCKELGLSSLECEFTYGVRMSNAEAKRIGELAKKLKIDLSVHAPYWINLNSSEKKKIEESKKRILDSCEKGHYLNADYIVFHPGFYQKKTPEETYNVIKEAIDDMQRVIKKNKWDVKLAPETTGKPSQFGDLNELLRLRKETKCELCIDFAHLEARYNRKPDYDELFKRLKKENIKHIHSHFSGIEYGEKGEKRHILTSEGVLKPLLKSIIKNKVDITIINESPDPFGDCVKTKRLLNQL